MKVGDLVMRSKRKGVFRPGIVGVILGIQMRTPTIRPNGRGYVYENKILKVLCIIIFSLNRLLILLF